MKSVDNSVLIRWRAMDSSICLEALADHAKEDRSFQPRADQRTSRWHAYIAGQDVELLCTGPKFWDTRAEHGGGGAVDLVMHLFGLDFKHAVAMLKDRGL